MRKGYSVLDRSNPNFLTQDGLNVKDGAGRILGTCDKKGITPIRAVQDTAGKIREVFCSNYNICKQDCPFSGKIEYDNSDYTHRGVLI